MDDQSKKHHYVPQSVLRHFSFDQAQKWIYVFDKAQMKSFQSSILNAGSENYFNAVQVEGQTVSFEGLFKTNDDQLARLLSLRKRFSEDGLTSSHTSGKFPPKEPISLSRNVPMCHVRSTISASYRKEWSAT